MEEWRGLEDLELSRYSVSSFGRVMNNDTDRILRQHQNQSGVQQVQIVDDKGRRANLSVAKLVASYFVPGWTHFADTPINLDGDRSNNHMDNLAWRSRRFAIRYNWQFENPPPPLQEIECENTLERFDSIRHAAVHYGLIETEIAVSLYAGTPVWPLGLVFRSV